MMKMDKFECSFSDLKLILLLLLLLAVPLFSNADSEFTIECTNIPPFLKQMQRGFFMHSSSFLTTQSWTHPSIEQNPMLEWSCNLTRTWSHPLIPEVVYNLPDQIEIIQYNSQTNDHKLNFTSRFYVDVDEVKEEFGRRAGIANVSEEIGAFSSAEQYKQYRDWIIKDGKIVYESWAKIGVISVKLRPDNLIVGYNLQEDFINYKERPNLPFDEFKLFWNRYILHHYGTHYLMNAEFGSLVWITAAIDPSYLVNVSTWTNVITDNSISRSVSNLVSGTEQGALDQEFRDKVQVRVCYLNGSPSSRCTTRNDTTLSYSKWVATNASHPMLLQGTLKPIENLFKDDQFIRKNLLIARQTQMRQLSIMELVETMKMGQEVYKFNKRELALLDDAYRIAQNDPLASNPRKSREQIEIYHKYVAQLYNGKFHSTQQKKALKAIHSTIANSEHRPLARIGSIIDFVVKKSLSMFGVIAHLSVPAH